MRKFSDDGAFLAALSRADVCGPMPVDHGYLASDGLGGFVRFDAAGPTPLARVDCAWDNHIITL